MIFVKKDHRLFCYTFFNGCANTRTTSPSNNNIMTQEHVFRIGDHTDLFTPTSTKGKYICPICGGNDFSIAPDGEKYNCYNSGGECNKDVFKWVGDQKGLFKGKTRQSFAVPSQPKEPITLATLVDTQSFVSSDLINHYRTELTLSDYEFWLNYPHGNKVKRVVTTTQKDGKRKREKSFYAYEKDNDKSKVTTVWDPYHVELFSQAKDKWILAHEGEKATDSAIEKGLISTCLLGSKATDKDFIKRLCERIKQYEIKGIIYISDNDKQGKDKANKLAYQVADNGVKILILPVNLLHKDIPDKGDFWEYSKLTNLSPTALKTNIELTVSNNLDNLLVNTKSFDTSENSTGDEGNTTKNLYYFLRDKYGSSLKFNELTQEVEMENDQADLENFYIELAVKHNQKINKNLAYDTAVEVAKLNKYHPVKDYLNYCQSLSIPNELKKVNFNIKSLSTYLFGTKDSLFDEMVYRFLIASVARVFKPGCKFDNALILQGKQGIGKSTFFKYLFGEKFFTDSLLLNANKEVDCVLTLHQHWCCELAEFETITSKKQAGELKAFLSRAKDNVRAPYSRTVKAMHRQGVIVGTVNNSEFLIDATGNRRFWVIPVKDKIPLDEISVIKDYVWKLATEAYLNNETWWLSYELESQSESNNQNFLHSDSWDNESLDRYLIGFETQGISIGEILIHHLGLEIQKIQKKDEIRLGQILTKKGWEKKRRRMNGKTRWVWFKDPD